MKKSQTDDVKTRYILPHLLGMKKSYKQFKKLSKVICLQWARRLQSLKNNSLLIQQKLHKERVWQ